MKRLLVLLLASMMLFAFVACDDNTPDPPAAEEPTPTPENPDKPDPDNPDNPQEPEEPAECVHAQLKDVTEWFDGENGHYPKSGVCALCDEKVTRENIEISTAEELMTLAKDMDKETAYDLGCYTISIIADIDMTGKDWSSPRLNGYNDPHNKKDFVINGNGHTISNLTAGNGETKEHQGFIGSTWSAVTLTINNLTLENATITANKGEWNGPGIGGFVGYIDSSALVEITNCNLVDSKITGGHWAGGVYGYAAGYDVEGNGPVLAETKINGCRIENVTITGDDSSVGGVMGHAGGNPNTKITVTDTVVTGCTITTENTGGSIKAGSVLGTNGVGDVTLTGVTETDNKVTNNGVSNDKPYGRLEFGENKDGSLTIDGDSVLEETN